MPISVEQASIKQRLLDWSLVVGLALILGSAMLLRPDLNYPGYWALFPSVGAAMAIAGGHRARTGAVGRLIASPAVVWLGDRSYSLYLWHWPALILGSTYFVGEGLLDRGPIFAVALLFAMGSYRLIEYPFWKGRFSRATPIRAIVISTLAIAAVTVGSLTYRDFIQVDPHRMSAIDVARSDMPGIYSQGCDSAAKNADLVPCVSGDADAPHIAVLLGDSIGVQWHSVLLQIFAPPDWQVITLTKSACPMVDEEFFYPVIGTTFSTCTEWREKVTDHIQALQPDVIFLGSASGYEFTPEQWVDGSVRLLSELTDAAEDVVIIPGTPALSFNGPSCLARHGTSRRDSAAPAACQEVPRNRSFADVARYLTNAATRFDNVRVLDLNYLVCPDGLCTARNADDLIVFRDTSHLTDSFVRSLIPDIAERLTDLAPRAPPRQGNTALSELPRVGLN